MPVKKKIEDIRNNIIDLAIVTFAALGVILMILVTVRAFRFGFSYHFILQYGLFGVGILLAFYRKRLSLILKLFVIVFLLTTVLISGLWQYGFLTSAKIYIVAIAVFTSFILRFRSSLIILTGLVTIYVVFAFLYTNGILKMSIDANAFTLSSPVWYLEAIILYSISFSLLYVGYKYNKQLLKNNFELQTKSRELEIREEKYRSLYETSNDAIFIIQGNAIIDCNKQTLILFSCERDYIIGKNPAHLSPERQNNSKLSMEFEEEILEQVYRGESCIFEWVHKKANGECFDSAVSLNLLQLEGEQYIQAVLRDITERKKVEKQLQASEERYKKLVESFPDVVMLSDINGNVFWGNEALETVFGITKDDYTNPNRKARIHPDDVALIEKSLIELIQTESIHSNLIENRFIDAWGTEHWVSGRMSKVYLDGELYIQTVSRDITQNKKNQIELEEHKNKLEKLVQSRTYALEQINEELLCKNEELKAANDTLNVQKEELTVTLDKLQRTQEQLLESEKMASIGILTAGVAHEINNPLNFITAGLYSLVNLIDNPNQLIEDDILSENYKQIISTVEEGVDRITKIVSSLNHFNRANNDFIESCNVRVIIENCLQILNHELKGRITIHKHFNENDLIVIGNEGKLHQVFINILHNASQAIGRKGSIDIHIKYSKNNEKGIIRFIDDGEGIEADNLKHIFNPFFTTKEVGKGTGLGLSIVYKIIQDHNGCIQVHSESGKGTEVYLELPATV